jgi:hypothetical protein
MEVGSFCWICAVLDLHPEALRKGIFTNPQVLTAMRKIP